MANKIENGSISVAQIMDNLTFGELKQHKLGGYRENNKQIAEADYPEVMSAINRGVNQIQQDLSVHENTVRLQLIEGVFSYPIHSKHSVTTGSDNYLYVDDSVYEPFEDDILRILQVYDVYGRELPINEHENIDSVFVPTHNVIQYPFAKAGDVLGIVYSRYTKPRSVTTRVQAEATYLAIPDHMLSALYAYVRGVMTPGISTEQEVGDSNNSMARYESIIAKLKHTPAIPVASWQNTKLHDRGFI